MADTDAIEVKRKYKLQVCDLGGSLRRRAEASSALFDCLFLPESASAPGWIKNAC